MSSRPSKWPDRFLIAGILSTIAGIYFASTLPKQWREAAAFEKEPQTITMSELAVNGPGDNLHIYLSQYRPGEVYLEEGYRSANQPAPKPGEHIQGNAYLPLFPENPIGKPFVVVLRTTTNHANLLAKNASAREPIRGMLVPPSQQTASRTQALPELAPSYPKIDFNNCYYLDRYESYRKEGAASQPTLTMALAGGTLGLGILCLTVAIIQIRARRKYLRLQREAENNSDNEEDPRQA